MDINWSVFPGVSLPFPAHYVIGYWQASVYSVTLIARVWVSPVCEHTHTANVCFKYLIIVSRGWCHSAGSLQRGMSSDYLSCAAQKKKRLQPLPTFLWLSFLLALVLPSNYISLWLSIHIPLNPLSFMDFIFPHLPLPLLNVSILVIPSTSSLAVFKAGFIPLYSSRHARDHLQQSRWSFCADNSTCEIHTSVFFPPSSYTVHMCVYFGVILAKWLRPLLEMTKNSLENKLLIFSSMAQEKIIQ